MFSLKLILIGIFLSTTSCSTIRTISHESNQEDNIHMGNSWSLYPQLKPYGYPILDYLRGSVSAVTAGVLGFMYGIYGPFVSVLAQPVISHALYLATDGAVAKFQTPLSEQDQQKAILIEPKKKRGRSKIDPAEVADLRMFARRTTDVEMKKMFNNFFSDNNYGRYGMRRIL